MPTLLATLLAAFAPAPAPRPAEPHRRRPRHAAPDPAPQRQARRVPPRIPDYPAFAATAEAHSARWEITYGYGSATPYTARHRVTGHVVAVSDLDLLDHVLTTYEPSHPVRGYAPSGA